MQVAITNNAERVQQIRLRSKNATQQAKEGKSGTVEVGPLISLAPGINLVAKELWDEAKANPNVSLLLKTPIPPSPAPEANPERVGKMYLVEGKELPDESPLRALSDKAAADMVIETLDVPLLKQWLVDEGRGSVRKAIEAQIKTIEEPASSNPGKSPRNRPPQQ